MGTSEAGSIVEALAYRPGAPVDLGQFRLTAIGLSVRGRPSLDEWQRMGAFLRLVEGAVQWAVGDWWNYGEHRYGERAAQAIDPADGTNRLQTFMNYAWVAGKFETSRRREVLSWSHHAAIASLEVADQDQLLEEAIRESWSVRDLRTAVRRSRRAAALAPGCLPAGKFRILLADPPWRYDDQRVITAMDNYGGAERHYQTMSVEDLCALPVHDHALADAVLFLWVPSPMLFEAKPVIDRWGFTYKTSFVWDKVRHNFGHYNSIRHEFLLVCVCGSCTPDAPTPMPDSVIVEERTARHSEKPASVRALIDRLYPVGPRVELFARAAVPPGWIAWGDQIALPPEDEATQGGKEPLASDEAEKPRCGIRH